MSDEVVKILASNIANQAITIAKQQSEISQLKDLLVRANEKLEKKKEVKLNEHTSPNANHGQE